MTSWTQVFFQMAALIVAVGAIGMISQPQYAPAVVAVCIVLLLLFGLATQALSECEALRERLDDIDRRTAGMEEHRAGNEVVPAPGNGGVTVPGNGE